MQPDGRPLPDAEHPEQRRRVRTAAALTAGQRVEAHLEAGTDGQIARCELVYPATLVGEAVGERPDLPAATGGQPGARDPDRQRQTRADGDDVAHRIGLGVGALGSDDAYEKLSRLGVIEHIEIDQPTARKIGQAMPGGHDHRARAAAGQQRANLRGVPRVIKHDQHLPFGQAGAVQGGPLFGVHRDPGPVHAEVPQEPGEHLVRWHGLFTPAAQADVELAVREIPPQRVCGVDGECGLTQAGSPSHHGDRHRRIIPPPASDIAAHSCSRFASRPVKSATSAGSWAGTRRSDDPALGLRGNLPAGIVSVMRGSRRGSELSSDGAPGTAADGAAGTAAAARQGHPRAVRCRQWPPRWPA